MRNILMAKSATNNEELKAIEKVFRSEILVQEEVVKEFENNFSNLTFRIILS